MAKKKAGLPPSSRPIDYPSSVSQYEREGLAAEAKLAEDKKKQHPPAER
jgi:hypothetical protein